MKGGRSRAGPQVHKCVIGSASSGVIIAQTMTSQSMTSRAGGLRSKAASAPLHPEETQPARDDPQEPGDRIDACERASQTHPARSARTSAVQATAADDGWLAAGPFAATPAIAPFGRIA